MIRSRDKLGDAMITCQNCGKENTFEINFCRFCGTRFNLQAQRSPEQPPPFGNTAPRPYSWKTDEFQTGTEARRTMPSGLEAPTPAAATLVHNPAGPQFVQTFRCPVCMSSYPPRIERRISTGGWITFAALLVFFFPLFWIGLLIKEDVVVCQGCNTKVSP